MKRQLARNYRLLPPVVTGMRSFDEVHISGPGLVVVEVAAADEATARAAVEELGRRWATSGPSAPWREPGEPGVRVRTYADVRHEFGS